LLTLGKSVDILLNSGREVGQGRKENGHNYCARWGLFTGRRLYRGPILFLMGQVERNMNRFIKIRIRLLVILRQIFQFFQ
jgi:hypothetical protein